MIQSKFENINESQINKAYSNIKYIFSKMESASFMKDIIKENIFQEKHFRDYFADNFKELERFVEIERITKSDRPTDLMIYLKNPNKKNLDRFIIEFKIWKRFKAKFHPIKQIIDNRS